MEDEMSEDRKKIVTYITPEADAKVEAFMRYSGMTKTKVCSLAIVAGIDALAMAVDPLWQEYFEKKSLLEQALDDEKKPKIKK